METTVTHISNGTEEDLKIFNSMLNSAQIDINAQHADQSMFTTPKTKYANEGFIPLKIEYKNGRTQIVTLGITTIVLVILLLAFHMK